MAEEHVTRIVEPRDGGTTHTTIITDSGARASNSRWLIAVVLLVAIVVGMLIFSRSTDSEAARDAAITNAANQVGSAASQVGNAAEDAADTMKK